MGDTLIGEATARLECDIPYINNDNTSHGCLILQWEFLHLEIGFHVETGP